MRTRDIPFSELLTAVVDNRGRTCPTVDAGIKLIATNCISNDALYPRYEKLRYVSRQTYDSWFRGHPQPGDLIFVCKGSPGRVAIVPDPVDFCIAQDMVAVRADSSKVHPLYLFAALRSPEVQNRIRNLHVGTMIPHFKKGDFGKLQIPVPDPERQAEIGNFYYALSRKIATNERIVLTADELAGKIFRRAASTAPDRFTEQALSDTADFINGRAFTKGATGSGRMVIRIAEINSGPGNSTVYSDVEVPEKHLARPGDVLFSWSGSLTVARWFRPESIINQHIFKCVPKNDYPSWLVRQLVASKIVHFRAVAAGKATTMGHIQRKHLDEPVCVPKAEELATLNSQIAPLWDRALLAERESLLLADLRDTLLAQLMAGRLRVKDAEKIVEDRT
ncbi:restriction endonuclease subunit S [Streptomyces chilikensis]|uniref:restriction endonuclease subunit S n=1 Tax=Streptomyces chilikensis TaxID=1194079 RepID=UPI000AB75C93|nr:restriction endonuclease subunit S [Streptomyces chilikensis]